MQPTREREQGFARDDDDTTWEIVEGDELVPSCYAWDVLGIGRRFEMWIAWCADRLTPICVKLPRRDQLDEATVDALRREYEAASAMSHPAIPRVFAADLEATMPYLVYEFIEGIPLSVLLDEQGPLDSHDVVLLGLQLAAVLRHVHNRGYVHLDVKPSNVAMRNDRAILLDFDIALPIGGQRSTTRPRGTPAYMAPEQIACEPAHPSMDLFSLGALLYEAATNVRPFEPNRTADTSSTSGPPHTYLQTSHATPPVEALAPGLAPAVAAAIESLMAIEPAGRPADAANAVQILESALPAGTETLWPEWVIKRVLTEDR